MEIWMEMMERVRPEVNKKAFHESEAANFGRFSSEFNSFHESLHGIRKC